jgi:WhiB family redox-sensing transcriptional regulator
VRDDNDRSRWREFAACVGTDPELFFTDSPGFPAHKDPRITMLRDLCARCPVNRECLDAALWEEQSLPWWGKGPRARTNPYRYGFRAGLTARERTELAATMSATAPAAITLPTGAVA